MKLGEVGKRRWRNFKANRRAYWSLWIFLAIFAVTLPGDISQIQVPRSVPELLPIQLALLNLPVERCK